VSPAPIDVAPVRGRRGLGRAGLLALVLLVAGPAWPHAVLVRSSPARRATLTTPPERVQLWFNEAVEPRFSTVSVRDAAGQAVDLGDARVEPGDSKRLVVGVRPLGPGTYRVRFRVLSVDGHVVEGEFAFAIRRS
jgi:methionine-rich copper-binding protein CopC